MSKCECELAGYCPRHQVEKGNHWHLLCQTRDDYRNAWDNGTGPGQKVPESVRVAREDKRERKRQLGRELWAELHSAENWTEKEFSNWVSRVPSFGCSCKSWLLEYLKTNPVRYDDLYAWSVECHDAVNVKRGRPVWNPICKNPSD